MSSLPQNQPDPDDLPDALIADLQARFARNTPSVPPSLDAAILSDARAGFARRRRFRLAARTTIAVASVAAIAVVALVGPFLRALDSAKREATQSARAPVSTQLLNVVPANEDVDGSGKVDILDAFVVAKLIETRKEIDESYDVNGDGKVDQSDVNRIALVAVDASNVDGEHVQ